MTGCNLIDFGKPSRQNGKLLPCERLMAENAKLQQKLSICQESEQEKVIGYLREEIVDWEDTYRAIVAENAKLRELVRDLWRFTGTACKKYPRLFDPAAQGGQMVYPNMIDAFEQRMRELGVETD